MLGLKKKIFQKCCPLILLFDFRSFGILLIEFNLIGNDLQNFREVCSARDWDQVLSTLDELLKKQTMPEEFGKLSKLCLKCPPTDFYLIQVYLSCTKKANSI